MRRFAVTHRLPDALAPLINVRRGAEGGKRTHRGPDALEPLMCDNVLRKQRRRASRHTVRLERLTFPVLCALACRVAREPWLLVR